VTFLDLPVADHKGYAAAVEAYELAKTAIRRKLNILDPELAAGVDGFEAWDPTPATTTVQ